MTAGAVHAISTLLDMADAFDVAVLDQWGVLHDGTVAYPGAPEAVARLRATGKAVVVLSNSGKRADVNAERIRTMGVRVDTKEVVTSGEALWRDVQRGRLPPFARPFAVTGRKGDAERWANGLDTRFTDDLGSADALLLMGLPEGAERRDYADLLDAAHERDLPLVCSNPDRNSPRAGGGSALQPGTLAHDYAARDGTVHWYGKPHAPVFRAVERLNPGVPATRHVMVGDSVEHDVAGGAAAGWRTCLVRGGLHADELDGSDALVRALCERHQAPVPDAHIAMLA